MGPLHLARACVAAGALALVLPSGAKAQDTSADIESLKKRVAVLEAKLPKDPVGKALVLFLPPRWLLASMKSSARSIASSSMSLYQRTTKARHPASMR